MCNLIDIVIYNQLFLRCSYVKRIKFNEVLMMDDYTEVNFKDQSD